LPTREIGGEGTGFVRSDEPWHHVMITSQTCDICEEGKKTLRFPWITVAPAYNILPIVTDHGQQKQIRAGRFAYLVPLTATEFQNPGELWVADLRIEYPLEKSVLVESSVRDAFATEEEYHKLAIQLANRRNRPAIDGYIRTAIIRPLNVALRSGRLSPDDFTEIRIRCGPTWDVVERAQLVFLARDDASVDELEGRLDEWGTEVQATLRPAFALLPSVVQRYREFSYADSLIAPLVDFSEFSE
jgi:hypothetical protein